MQKHAGDDAPRPEPPRSEPSQRVVSGAKPAQEPAPSPPQQQAAPQQQKAAPSRDAGPPETRREAPAANAAGSPSKGTVAGAGQQRPRRARWWLRAAVVAILVVGLAQFLPENTPGPTADPSAAGPGPGSVATPSAPTTPVAGRPPVTMADEQRAVRRVRSDLSSSALVRDYPDTQQGRVLTSLAPGSEVETMGRVAGGEWLRVDLRGHSQAYIHSGLLGEEAPSRPASRVAGRLAGVADTATLRVDGLEVRLHGIAPGTREPYTTELSHFVRDLGNEVECTHVEDGLYRCSVSAGDLGEIILLNGAGRASPAAPQSYLDHERVAREEGRGLWAR